MRFLSVLMAFLLVGVPFAPCAAAQDAQAPVAKLSLVIVEGEGAIHNIKQRTARETIVQVEDANHRPVAGAAVAFTLPGNGASGTFANGSRTITTVTDSQGRRFDPAPTRRRLLGERDGVTGNQVVTGTITQTNGVVGAAAGALAGGFPQS
jgi:hypothetical protein